MITDTSGAAVPGVAVAIVNTDTGVVRNLVSNNDGVYDAVSILPGKYEITFDKSGFEKLVRSGIDLTANAITIDAQLKIGTAQQRVEVTADASVLQTESAEQSTTLTADTMAKLPNVGLDWGNFTRILPGAAGSGQGVAVNGNMPFNARFLADGANVTLGQSSNLDTMLFNTVAEVQVETATFSAQYGTGGIVMNQISKGGTNTWHGTAYEYFRNDFFNAKDYFATSAPYLRFHQFGGNVAGPILKNKLFFFFNVEKVINNGQYVSVNTYPTASMRQGIFSDPSFPTIYNPATQGQGPGGSRLPFAGNSIQISQLDPLALKFQNLFPLPNQPGFVNNWVGSVPALSPTLGFFGRLDYDLSSKNRLTISTTQGDNPAYYPAPDVPMDSYHADLTRYQAQISDVWTISPTVVNEFRFGYTRQANVYSSLTVNKNYPQLLGWNYAESNEAPQVYINGTCCSGVAPGTNVQYNQNTFDPSDVVTMIRGKHILHFGGEVLMFQNNSTPWGNINSGSFSFSGVFTQRGPNDPTNGSAVGQSGLAYADFLLGQVDSWNASNSPLVGTRQRNPQVFIQDDWKLLPNLTINLGLRYQIQGGWSEVANRMGEFDPSLINPATNTPGAIWFAGTNGRTNLEKNNYKVFLPRVGLAWSPLKNWSVRGGFGIYSTGWSLDQYSAGAQGLGTNSQGYLQETNQQNPVFVLSQATKANLNYVLATHSPDGLNGQNVNYIPYDTPVGRNYQWSVSIQHQFGTGMMVEAAYVGNHGTNLSFPFNLNQLQPSQLQESIALSQNNGDPQTLRRYPQYLGISANLYNAISNYNALQLSFKKRMSYGLQFDANYTWSKMLDEQDSSGFNGEDGGQVWQNGFDPRSNYGRSNFDIPQMFKGDLTYELPFGKGRTFMSGGGLSDAFLGGWQVSSLFALESGHPYTVTVGTANNSGSLAGTWYPNLIGNPSVANPNANEWFNPAAYAIPAAGTYGNSGRNTLRGPGIIGVDFSMGKNFKFPLPRETGNLEIRFDASNILNHPNLETPNAGIGTGQAGVITSTNGNYGSTNNVLGSRQLQLGVKFSF